MYPKMEKMGHTRYMKNKFKEVHFKQDLLTTTQGYVPIEGGGLNASYTTVDAVANLCNTAGILGLRYGKDFIWSNVGYDDDGNDTVTLLVKDKKYESFLHIAIQNKHRIMHTTNGDIILTKEAK